MRKNLIFVVLFCCFFVELWGEVLKEEISKKKSILLIFEEKNSSIDPWRNLFMEEFKNAQVVFEEISASNVTNKDFSKYDSIIIYGAVMAFTMKEPVRDWLSSETNLSGKSVGLFVTANRWFLEKYFNQLLELLKKKNANIVDAVSYATQKLSEEDRRKIVREHIDKMK